MQGPAWYPGLAESYNRNWRLVQENGNDYGLMLLSVDGCVLDNIRNRGTGALLRVSP